MSKWLSCGAAASDGGFPRPSTPVLLLSELEGHGVEPLYDCMQGGPPQNPILSLSG